MATKPTATYRVVNSDTVQLSFDQSWNRLVSFFGTKNMPIKNLDKNSGFIAIEYEIPFDSLMSCMDCGSAGFGYFYAFYTLNINVVGKPLGEAASHYTINTFWKTKTCSLNQYSQTVVGWPVDCISTGKFENEIWNYLKK
jgi:hypothetical protein